jgi:hypothetical protein
MLKRFVIWVMLIALPLQNYAAAAMMHCAPMHEAMAAQMKHHHETMMDMGMHQDHISAHAAASRSDGGHSVSHLANTTKCSACSTCCMSLMAVAYPPLVPPTLAGMAVLVPHPVLALPSVVLEGPQRPPRPSFA